jgi:hypothetical protein
MYSHHRTIALHGWVRRRVLVIELEEEAKEEEEGDEGNMKKKIGNQKVHYQLSLYRPP